MIFFTEQILKCLKNNEKVAIFPEGTRNKTKTNDLQEIKGGAGVFAVKAKCCVVPMMMLKKPKLFCKTKVIVGEPFELSEFYDLKLASEVIKSIDDKITCKMNEQYLNLLKLTQKNKREK